MDTVIAQHREARRALALLGGESRSWVEPGAADHDVVVIGAGQSGIAIAFALRRKGVSRVAVYDEGRAGVDNWNSTARMLTLRTPKTITGLEQGIAEWTFQAWYERRNGAGSFADIGRIRTADWAAYVAWIREVSEVQVQYGNRLVDVEPAADLLRLTLQADGAQHQVLTRKLVLATGMGGFGDKVIPAQVQALPRSSWSHTHDAIDFAALAGKRVAVLGAGSSAFDNAAVALEHGAAAVDLYCRHDALTIQRTAVPITLITDLTITTQFYMLPDDLRWKIITRTRPRGLVPEESIARAQGYRGFSLLLGEQWDAVDHAQGHLEVSSKGKRRAYDYLITATGYSVEPEARPELARITPHVLRWGDHHRPEAQDRSDKWAAFPYVGPAFELQAREPGKGDWIRHVHVFNFAAILNHGFHVGDISSASVCVPRLVDALVQDLFLANPAAHLRPLLDRIGA